MMGTQKTNGVPPGSGFVQCTARRLKEKPALEATLARLMLKHLLAGIHQQVGPGEAGRIACESGYMAGEDFLYQYLDLQDPPKVFYQKLIEKGSYTGFPLWDIEYGNNVTGQIEIRFAGIRGCRGKDCKKPPLQCEFMKGYLAGILECYTGGNCKVAVHCGAMADQAPLASNRCCCFTIWLEKAAGWV